MLNLIRKDILIQKREKTIVFALLLGAAAAVLLPNSPTFAIGNIIVATYLMTVYVNAYDYKYNAEIAFVSLPIRRRDMVIGRYISVFLFALFVLFFSMMASFLFCVTGWFDVTEGWNLPLVGLLILAVALYYTVFLPLYFAVGYLKSRWANYLSLVVTYGALGILQEKVPVTLGQSRAGALTQMLQTSQFLIFVVGALILLSVSVYLSIKTYERKEF